ncbi:DoxX family protein [Lysobacter sp. S4-A87]|uniref:HvfX family Cu-binding RiPP maturation protein n=1 Tax=Lysobacter sp. S4-A87 TaxID=2925843 RepID=UPI001F52E9DA|nr:DoxX family protein [Lysobacter sp. S4-A87]UNK49433.1 DoxX family protein [Lysobacter sp. S4-A87]
MFDSKYGLTTWRNRLEGMGAWVAPLGLRLVLAWEFFEAGREKLRGENWFGQIMEAFPFPFDRIPADLSWTMATWFELIGGIALLIGMCTRFFAASLFVLTVVAIAAVHWPTDWMGLAQLAQGYAISDAGAGNYKLPLIFLVMLVPLIFHGGGRLSIDVLAARLAAMPSPKPHDDAVGWGVVLLLSGPVVAMLLPLPGALIAAAGPLLLLARRWLR